MLGRALLLGVVVLLAVPAQGQAARAILGDRPAVETAATEASFTFGATAGALFSGFECRLDGGPWAGCMSPHRISGLTGGSHGFAVRLTGLFADRTPDAWTWTVTVPTVALPVPVAPLPGVAPVPARDPKRRDARGCAHGPNRIDEATLGQLEAATICLINVERAAHGLQPVRRVGSLATAARRHARDMVQRAYFAHISPAGGQLADRVKRAGYLRGVNGWGLGEVLGWAANPPATPDVIVRAWMRSASHRHVLLDASYRDAGAGAITGAPRYGVRSKRAATYTAVLGRRG